MERTQGSNCQGCSQALAPAHQEHPSYCERCVEQATGDNLVVHMRKDLESRGVPSDMAAEVALNTHLYG
jgi:hypothetical protein